MKREVMGLIVKREDGSEIVNYDDPAFPSYIYEGWVFPKVTWERVPHYHEDIEMIAVTEGTLGYSVNGKIITLKAGDTIFINSNQIHYLMAMTEEIARYIIFVFHPGIISTSPAVEMRSVVPVTGNEELPYIRFHKINENAADIMELMKSLPDIRRDPFLITKTLYSIWEIILKQSNAYGFMEKDDSSDSKKKLLKTMMHFVHSGYREAINLEDIAASANISKSFCNRIFKEYLQETPVNYVMHFRARKVAEYLRSGDLSLDEIAKLTGFNGTSYMSEIFKRFFDTSPLKYRKQWRLAERNLE